MLLVLCPYVLAGCVYVEVYVQCVGLLLVILQVICLSPTFDLAKQTGSVLEQMAKFCPEIRVMYAVRGERGEEESCNLTSSCFLLFLL